MVTMLEVGQVSTGMRSGAGQSCMSCSVSPDWLCGVHKSQTLLL